MSIHQLKHDFSKPRIIDAKQARLRKTHSNNNCSCQLRVSDKSVHHLSLIKLLSFINLISITNRRELSNMDQTGLVSAARQISDRSPYLPWLRSDLRPSQHTSVARPGTSPALTGPDARWLSNGRGQS